MLAHFLLRPLEEAKQMKRAAWYSVFGVCVGLTMGCGGRSDAEHEQGNDNDFKIAGTAPMIETGCLTSSGDRFVLTALDGGGNGETELYQLIGHDDELRKLMGREVRITGDAAPAQIAQIEQPATSSAVGTGGSSKANQGQVRTEAETRIETRQLRVATVTATGDECSAGATTR
jgi:hypothetical protein